MADADHFRSAINMSASKTVPVSTHLNMLSVAQKHTDSGVSKTINMPNHYTVEQVAEAILTAWVDPYIKGTALYRDGSRNAQVLSAVELCPECGAILATDGGCETCVQCGYSLCSIA